MRVSSVMVGVILLAGAIATKGFEFTTDLQAAQIEPVMLLKDVKAVPDVALPVPNLAETAAKTSELDKREVQLAEREKAAAEKEALLGAFESRVKMEVEKLETVRDELSALRDGIVAKSSEDEKKLSAIYAGMRARDAARILNTMPVKQLVKIFDGMTEVQATPILGALDAPVAKDITTIMMDRGAKLTEK